MREGDGGAAADRGCGQASLGEWIGAGRAYEEGGAMRRVLGWERGSERGLAWRDRQERDHMESYSGSPEGVWIF